MTSQLEKEFEEYELQQLWPMIYQKIKNESSLKSISEKHSVREARKPENRSKNRYRDVSPYDHSRVILQSGDSDYINASVIDVPESGRTYILSQGPLEHTAGQFWQMIWEQNTKAVIMLNRVIEKGTLKCHQYWPLGVEEDDEDEIVFEETGLKVTLVEDYDTQHYIIRTFELENTETGEKREVYHFHYTTWPDFGIPSSPLSFLLFLQAVREKGVLEPDVGPAVIHCSAGIGRSGTFCLVDSALVLIEKQGTMEGIDLQTLLIDMRCYRMGLIQTYDQLKFSYMAVIAGGRQILASVGSQQVNNVLDDYLEKEDVDKAPTPPKRVESLSTTKRDRVPPPPPPRSFPADEDTTTAESESTEPQAKQPKLDDDTEIPQKPPRAHTFESSVNDYETVNPEDLYLHVVNSDNDQDTRTLESSSSEPPSSTSDKLPENSVTSGRVSHAGENHVGDERDSSRDWDVKSGENQTGEHGEVVRNNEDQEGYAGPEQNSVEGTSSDPQLRQRRKDERDKRKEKTQELLREMKEKQKKSETWKKRRSYAKPVVIGISLLIGSYLLYKFYNYW